MSEKLPKELIDSIITDIGNNDTYANKKDVSNFLNKDIYDYLVIEKSNRPAEEGEKAVITQEGRPAYSIKAYNFILNLKSLWEKIPGDIVNLANLLSSDEIMTKVCAVLHFVKRAGEILGLFVVRISKEHEIAFIIIACRSRRKHPVSFDTIRSAFEDQRRSDGHFPHVNEDELQNVLEDLKKMKCIVEDTQGRFTSNEKLILK